MVSQITSLTIVYSTVYSGADQRKHQSSASLAFMQGIHWWPVNPPHKWPVTRKIFLFDDFIMSFEDWVFYLQVRNETWVNTLRPRWNRLQFADGIFKCIFLNETIWFSIEMSLKFVPRCSINNIPSLVQVMAWRRPGDKPLSEPMMVRLPTHTSVTWPEWVK